MRRLRTSGPHSLPHEVFAAPSEQRQDAGWARRTSGDRFGILSCFAAQSVFRWWTGSAETRGSPGPPAGPWERGTGAYWGCCAASIARLR